MVRRRQRNEEHGVNHERWVISYADFITLLFAFFVVMYSISSVNVGKYKVLSASMINAFTDKAKTLKPLTVGDQDVKTTVDRLIELPMPGDYPRLEEYKYTVEGLFDNVDSKKSKKLDRQEDNQAMGELSEKLTKSLDKLVDSGLASIKSTKDWIEVNIKSSVLFPSGNAIPSRQARKIVDELAQLLIEYDNPVHVEGFTDNIPIQNDFYPSNWELSAARAAAVVRLLELGKVAPARLAAVGYAEFRPIADNATEEGRSKNRRVALIISKQKRAEVSKPAVDVEQSPDYKVGSVIDTAEAESSESGNAFSPEGRQAGETPTTKTVPLKIIKLENGGILFSAEPEKTR